MSEAAEDQRMTVAEFLRWQGEPDVRYELVDGHPLAMSPAASFHGTIVMNAGHEITRRLEARAPCRAQGEAGVWITDESFYEADVAVSCTDPANTAEVREPLLVVEVLSPATRTHDKGRKLDDYKGLESVQEVWLIDSEKRWVQVWRRLSEGWAGRDYVGRAGFESGALGEGVALDRLYRNTTL